MIEEQEIRPEIEENTTLVTEPLPVEQESPPKPSTSPKSVIREYFESAIVTVIMALFGMTFVVQAVKVPTGSMQNNILIGDHLLVNKFAFAPHPKWMEGIFPFRQIKRGDVIVFKYPKDTTTNYVKRVIGMPGETIEVRGSRVFINGEELPEQRAVAEDKSNDAPLEVRSVGEAPPGSSYTVYYRNTEDDDVGVADYGRGEYGVNKPLNIPEGHYFAMGDNRDNSADGRVWGTVPRDYIIGRALIVYWSIDRTKDYDTEDNKGSNFLVDFLTRTRWSRTGKLIK